jgi:hypothetical protein
MMHRSVTAALLSGLVFPGTGQIYLGRRRRGWLFALLALAAVLYLAGQLLGPALAMTDAVRSGALALDPDAIALWLAQHGHSANGLHTLAVLVMLLSWIASTIDAWWLGRKPY